MFYNAVNDSYLHRRLASGEGIVTLGVCVCVCLSLSLCRTATARRISLGGEGNALYPVLSSLGFCLTGQLVQS